MSAAERARRYREKKKGDIAFAVSQMLPTEPEAARHISARHLELLKVVVDQPKNPLRELALEKIEKMQRALFEAHATGDYENKTA